MAEFVFKNMINKMGISHKYEVSSSATSSEEIGNSIHYGTRAKLLEKKIPFEERRAVQLKKSDYDKYDLFIGMDSANIRNMHRMLGGDPENKIRKLMDYTGRGGDVADPWYSERFDIAYRDISDGCAALLEQVI